MKPKKPIFTIFRRRKPPLGRRCHTHFWLRRCRHLRSRQRSTFSLLRWRGGIPFCDGATTIAAPSPGKRSRWWTGHGPTRVTHRVCQQIHHSFRPVLGSGPCIITRIGRVLAINTLKNLNDTLAVPLPASVAATAAISTGSPEEASGPRRRSRR